MLHNLLILGIAMSCLAAIVYYIYIIVELFDDGFDRRKDFYLALIPFFYWFRKIVEQMRELR
jgi:hypothetical protein